MPRVLSNDPNKLTIQDNISGSDIVFDYRLPTTDERMAYSNESFKRDGKQVVSNVGETRQKYGLEILAGIREGDFVRKLDDGTTAPLSSDEASPHYEKEWKSHLSEYASDLIELLAVHMFDMPAVVKHGGDVEKN